jgi:hypothetical protein
MFRNMFAIFLIAVFSLSFIGCREKNINLNPNPIKETELINEKSCDKNRGIINLTRKLAEREVVIKTKNLRIKELEEELSLIQENYEQVNKSKKIYSNSKYIWIDYEQSLMWQKYKDEEPMNWSEAKIYCENLTLSGLSDWRLPSRDEAKNILTEYYGEFDSPENFEHFKKWFNKHKQKRNNEKFLNSKIYKFFPPLIWSIGNSRDPWIVRFHNGMSESNNYKNKNFVLCVRDLESGL